MATASSTVYFKLDPDTRQLLVRLIHAIEKLQPPAVVASTTFAESPEPGPITSDPSSLRITDESGRTWVPNPPDDEVAVEETPRVVDLMAALEASLAAAKEKLPPQSGSGG